MSAHRKSAALLGAAALIASAGAVALADDGYKVSKSMSHEGNPPAYEGYELENEHAFIQMMNFYVPMQGSNGTLEPTDSIEYYNVDRELEDTRTLAKPLVGVYINGPVEGVDGVGFVGHGMRDAYAAVSLDDGTTWKNTNLSESATESSQTREDDVYRTDVPLFLQNDASGAYPGDVVNIFHAVAGNKVLVAWPSRYCSSGQPNYSLDSLDPEAISRREAIAAYLGITDMTSPEALYLVDMYRVAGQQSSVDYAEDKWEQNHVVGVVPFNCVWTARGELVNGDDPRTADVTESTFMRWFKAERLTSGRRDANRIEVQAVSGAGFAITWQEDPDGLRPGQGEGPGEGWSGAIGNSGTDIWYSYIDWEDFDLVQDPVDETGATVMTFADYEIAAASVADITQKPKPFVPMAMPMPITDNAKCNPENPAPYCYGSALVGMVPVPTDSSGVALDPADFGLKDMCADLVEVPTGPQGDLKQICVSADGMPNIGNTASTRARLNLFGYDSTGTAIKSDDYVIDSAFVVVQVEEDKGLGAASYLDNDADGLPDGIAEGTMTACEPTGEGDKTCIAWDIGKNQRYHSFSMSLTDPLVQDEQDGLIANLTFPGHLLNQPEINWQTGVPFPTLDTDPVWDFGDYDYEIVNTEIARRGSLLAQPIEKVHKDTSDAKSGLVALPTWKQGLMNQGGPADVMSRQIVMETNWKLSKDGNPYAFRNMECKKWDFKDGSNPYYPGGVCLDPAINVSGTIPDSAIDSQTGAEVVPAPYVLDDGTSALNPILQGLVQGEGDTTKVLLWHQCPADYTVVTASDGTTVFECAATDSTLDDQSWYNPYDVAKGHRGYLDGDFVMILYAWSPNWRLNAVGNDRYELYIRRSFDGAESWTTLPKNYTHWDGSTWDGDGTVACETYRTADQQQQGDSTEPRVCYSYEAGGAEQARNVTQHASMRTTTLDPRYAPTAASITSDLFGYGIPGYDSGGDSEDVRDPSRYFIVYETGDNTTTEFGEPEPLDLFYSRAVNFGDDYQVWAEETDLSVCYPSDPHDDDKVAAELIGSGFCNEFDQLEQGTPGLEASEASLAANPGGEFMYAAWAEMAHDTGESDARVRRVWWIDDFIGSDAWVFGQGPDANG